MDTFHAGEHIAEMTCEMLTNWSAFHQAETRSPIASEGLSLTAVRSAGALLAFGGYNGKYHNSAQVYRPGEHISWPALQICLPSKDSGRQHSRQPKIAIGVSAARCKITRAVSTPGSIFLTLLHV